MVPKPAADLADLYETDEVAWLDAMVELLDLGAVGALDLTNLREYLSDMSGKERREVRTRLTVLLVHILKWEHQPAKRSESWRDTIFHQQYELNEAAAGGVLRAHAEESLPACYQRAVTGAAKETRLPVETLPPVCPFTLDQALAFDPPPLTNDGDTE